MELDLDALERIAKDARTPGPWETRCEGYREPTRVCHDSEYVIYLGYDFAADLGAQDAEHIAAFDPPTALALIARVRELEAIVNDGGNQAAKYWTRLTDAERERDRYQELTRRAELQCEDAEREAARFRVALEEALAEEERCTENGTRMWRILTRALNDKEAEK